MDLASYFNSPRYSDLVIQTETDKIHVHKIILCYQSIYFARMLESAFKESDEPTIELKEDNPSALFVMLQHMYAYDQECDKTRDIPFLVALYHLADKYDAPKLRATYLQSFNNCATIRWGTNNFIDALQDIFEGATADKSLQQAAISCCTAHIGSLLLSSAFNKVLENTAPLSAALLHQVVSGRGQDKPLLFRW